MKNAWGLDTMCSCHLTPHKDAFIGKIKYRRVPIEVANGETIYSAGKGDVRIFWKTSKSSEHINSTIIRDVLYVPKSSISLISLGMLAEKGVTWTCDDTQMSLFKNGDIILRGIQSDRVYSLCSPVETANSSLS